MTGTQFASYVRLQTKTNSTTLSDANICLLANIIKDGRIAPEIVSLDEAYFGMPERTDLVNGQREYPLPVDMISHLKKVEAVLDPTQTDANGNPIWIDIHEMDLNEYSSMSGSVFARDVENDQISFTPTTDEPKIVSVFANQPGRCAYFLFRNSLWIYSGVLANFTGGNQYLKIWSYTWPFDLTPTILASSQDLSVDASTTSPGIPRAAHVSWADMVITRWKETSDKDYHQNVYEQGIDQRWEKAKQTLLGLNEDRSFTLTMPNGGHMYDDGYNC